MAECKSAAGSLAGISENITILKNYDGQNLTLSTSLPNETFLISMLGKLIFQCK